MAEESKQVDPTKDVAARDVADVNKAAAGARSDDGSGSEAEAAPAAGTSGASKKKKKKNKKKGKEKEESIGDVAGAGAPVAVEGMSDKEIRDLLSLNPGLASQLQLDELQAGSQSAVDLFKRLNLHEIMTGLATSGKNVKDMGSYKFWSTQPVPQFGEQPQQIVEGPVKIQKIEDVKTEPVKLAVEGFQWVTMDLTNDEELAEVGNLLYGHYVEDDEAMFRLKYSNSILKWCLLAPGWKKEWHVGIRSGKTLCAFISAIPVETRVRDNVLHSSEVNFLCVHKKLRGKRLTPILIQEITRRCNLEGVWQAIYTGGVVLPRPVSTTRYFHRAINWQKLFDVGFSPCPPGSKPAIQNIKYKLPDQTKTKGLRKMEKKDVDVVHDLLERYLNRFQLAPIFTKEETEHWLLNSSNPTEEQIVWTYVVEDDTGKVTDFFSFYCLESSVIKSEKHSSIRAAYLFYYASETGLKEPFSKPNLKKRLNELTSDALIIARDNRFDVFNALSLMDNGLFLEQQKFGPGDGQLHYYLFNYKANPIGGGVDAKNRLDADKLSGVGFVML
ncbi:hypothetical protein OQA88_3010 [Cercophora sp. LCS_1]